MKSRAERLYEIIARAAPPHEREAGTWLTPLEEQNPARVARLVAQWRKAVGQDADVERAVLAVRVSGELPPWAAAFLELASSEDLFAPARAFAARFAAQEDLLRVFQTRVHAIVTPVFEYERQLAAATAALGPSTANDDWLDRFERFPVLAFLLGMAFTQWRDSLTEMFERLAADRPELGRVTAFRGDAGDVHGGGRAVALLTFESGKRLVYKPKDLRCAAAFNDLIALLEPSLRTREIVVRDGYGWEEFIPHRPCASAGEVALFYRRFGMLVRLLQLVEARDFWLDNLIADGAQPVFIDLETILQPRMRTRGLSAAEAAARHRLGDTIVESCTIAMATPIDVGISAEDLGALAPPREYTTPFRHGGKFISWSHHEHAPVLEGVAGDPTRHLEAIVDGYRHMHALIEAMRDALLADGSPLLRLRDAPVRFIHLDTWTYYKLLQRSYAPPLLGDGVQREIALLQLVGQAEAGEEEITLAEVEALRQMDVPLFLSLPSTPHVRTPMRTTIENYFDGTAWARVERRVREEFPLEEELDMLRACFSTVYGTTPLPPALRATLPSGRMRGADPVRIADAILRDTIARDGELAAIGIAYHPHIDLLGVEVLHPDLLSGTCGLALFFAELFAATHETRFASAARSALPATIRAVRKAPGQWTGMRDSGTPLYCGALLGAGAHLFTLRACAELLADPALDAIADAFAAAIPVDSLIQRCTSDYVAGTTGLCLALGSATAARRPFAPPPFPQKRRSLDIVPSADAAFALARSRAGEVPETFPLDTIGNIRAALEIDRYSAAAIDRAREIDDRDLALDVFDVTGDARDRDRAARLARACTEPSRYDLSALWGRVAQARALLRLQGVPLASITTLRRRTERGASASVSGGCS